jgi:hypothetical protein
VPSFTCVLLLGKYLPIALPVNRLLAFFLVGLVLLQTLGREVLVLDYQLNKAQITALYCVNKARPQLHCNGKCHLAQQLRKADGTDKKSPAGPATAKVKYEVLPTAAFAWRLPQRGPRVAPSFPALSVAACRLEHRAGVFRPPLLLLRA